MMIGEFSRSSQPDLDHQRQKQLCRQRLAAQGQMRQSIEQEAMDDMRRCIPVGQMLRVARPVGIGLEQLDVTAGADRRAAHPVFDNDLRDENGGAGGKPEDGGTRRTVFGRYQCRHFGVS